MVGYTGITSTSLTGVTLLFGKLVLATGMAVASGDHLRLLDQLPRRALAVAHECRQFGRSAEHEVVCHRAREATDAAGAEPR